MASKKNTRKATTSTITKKATVKKRVAPRRVSSSTTSIDAREALPTPARSARTLPTVNKRYLYIVLIAILVLGLLYLMRSFFVAAVVNGQPIPRVTVISELEKQSGKQALDTLVTKTLIMQEAKKQNVSIPQAEIDTELKKIEDNVKKQGQTLDQALAMQGMTREALVDQLKIQKIVEKVLGKDIQVTDQEVAAYITENAESLGETAQSDATKVQVKEQLTQQKLGNKFQPWIENLQKNAKINYFVNY